MKNSKFMAGIGLVDRASVQEAASPCGYETVDASVLAGSAVFPG